MPAPAALLADMKTPARAEDGSFKFRGWGGWSTANMVMATAQVQGSAAITHTHVLTHSILHPLTHTYPHTQYSHIDTQPSDSYTLSNTLSHTSDTYTLTNNSIDMLTHYF